MDTNVMFGKYFDDHTDDDIVETLFLMNKNIFLRHYKVLIFSKSITHPIHYINVLKFKLFI